MTGAQFEIRIDGTPRTCRDRKDYAMEAARLIKSKNPHSNLELPLLLGWPHPLNTRTAVPREACTLYPAQRHVTPGGIETSPGAAKTRLRRALSIP
jgi:hypothetical protein